MSPHKPRYAMLNSMAGDKIDVSIRRQAAWGITDLDLKDCVFGQKIEDIDADDARRVAELAASAGQHVYCLSSGLLGESVEEILTPSHAATVKAAVGRLIRTAAVLRPTFVRLLAPSSPHVETHRAELRRRGGPLEPLMAIYRDAVDTLADAGHRVTIENEAHRCLLASPDDVLAFFDRLDRPGRAVFTWDVQNLWQNGTFPTLAVYHTLRPLIGFYHVKGGRAGDDGRTLAWKSTLADASWPVLEITRAVVADGVSPVICINPSHGQSHPDFPMDDFAERDLDFLRRHFG